MNKPLAGKTAHTDMPAPVVLVPKPSALPPVPSVPHSRRIWIVGALLSLSVVAAVALGWWLSGSGGVVRYTATVSRGDVTRTVIATWEHPSLCTLDVTARVWTRPAIVRFEDRSMPWLS
jgi:hypothetical protein